MAHIADVIKYEGDNSTFIWKHPCEDFNTKSQLIVHESQEAILLMDGQALDTFGPGRHTLDTKNIPILGKFLNRIMGGESPFHCEVYFINKTVQMSIKWGTYNKIRYIDPIYKVPFEIGANGELNLAVSDSRALLLKLVGTMEGIAWGDRGAGFTKSLQECFRPLIATSARDALIKQITRNNIDLLEIEGHLTDLSEAIRQNMLPGFEEYGLTIPQFYINSILFPENDPNYKEIIRLRGADLKRKSMDYDVDMATIDAEGKAKIAKIQSDAKADAARNELENQAMLEEYNRKMKLAQDTTDLERTRIQMEKERLITMSRAEQDFTKGQVDAQVKQMSGLADAEIMAAKGYTQRDVLEADVKKAYAEGIGNMTINGSGGGLASDMISFGMGMHAMNAVAPQINTMFNGINQPAQAPAAAAAKCAKCGNDLAPNAKFCLECGTPVAVASAETINCPNCGKTVAKGKFCPECGTKFITNCPKCGNSVTPGTKFCPECGEKL